MGDGDAMIIKPEAGKDYKKQVVNLDNYFNKKQKEGGSVSWNWKGKSYSGTLIPSMENENNRYARTKNGKIKTLPKGQYGNREMNVIQQDNTRVALPRLPLQNLPIIEDGPVQSSGEEIIFENAFDGSSSGNWLEHSLTDLSHNNSSSTLAVSSSGLPYVVISDDIEGVVLRTPKSMTALENEVQSLGTSPQFIGQSLDLSNKQHIAYSTTGNTQVYVNKETTSGWTFENIRSSVSIASPINVLTDSNNSSHIIYRDSSNQQMEYAFYLNGWNIQNLGISGRAASASHSSVWLPNGDLAIGLIEFDGNNHNLSLWTWNGTVLNSSVIRAESDLATNIQVELTDDGTIILAALTSTGSLSLYERIWDQTAWSGILIDQPIGSGSEMSFDLIGGQNPAIAVRADSNSIYVRQASETWVSMASQPNSSPQGTWSLSQIDTHYLLFTTNPDSGLLQWNSVEKTGINDNFAPWFSQTFSGLITSSQVTPLIDENGTMKIAAIDEVQNQIVSLNFYLDSDRDLVFDRIDDLPHLSGQWSDSDGDGYGDSILGPQFDSCPQDNRTSSIIIFGCSDYDDDGYADTIDTCNNIRGFSWLGRTGCGDFDQDGWSDNKISYQNGDIFTDNWKQVFDSDGDGYGGGEGDGLKRVMQGGNIVPRNTLPLWGRGSKNFDTFFWDGKVTTVDGKVISQLGLLDRNYATREGKYNINVKDNALLTAVHLPFVEIRELVQDLSLIHV